MTDTNPTVESTQHRDEPEANRDQIEFDSQTESVSEALITTVAAREDVQPTELPVINDFIDPETPDALFEPRPDDTVRQTDCTIFFTYADYEVRVQSDGIISLSPASEQQTED